MIKRRFSFYKQYFNIDFIQSYEKEREKLEYNLLIFFRIHFIYFLFIKEKIEFYENIKYFLKKNRNTFDLERERIFIKEEYGLI